MAEDIIKVIALRIACCGFNVSIHGRIAGSVVRVGRIFVVTIHMALVPRRAGIFGAAGLKIESGYRGPVRVRIRSVSRLAVKGSAISSLGIAVGLPIVGQVAEVVVERPVFLRNYDDVIDGIKVLWREGSSDACTRRT